MRKRLAAFVAVVLLAALGTQLVAGDGSEQLGTPSIPIANGTDIVAAGTGLLDSSGTIDITIPGGATVLQVLLYWENFERDGRTHDDDLTVNGVDVVGTSIGGPTSFFASTTTQTFRADITALGAVVPGANSVAIGGAFSTASNGAGIVAIIDDGTNQVIDVRDGNDAAWIGLAPPLKDTTPVTYTFDAAASDRTATLDMFFSSVTGSFSTGILRPTSIEVESGGVTTVYSNLLDSNDGDEWDTVELSVNVPAGATSVTVQAFSRDDLGSGDNPASFVASVAALTLPVEEDAPAEGRMTGGGHFLSSEGEKVTLGLTIHCDIDLSNNIQVNWPGANNWHLEKESLTSVVCIDTTAVQPPPAAPFDTFIAEAVGKLNGEDGSIIRFTFTDAGEPGEKDQVDIKIWNVGDDPDVDAPVLVAGGDLKGGNIQAHYDQPHGQKG